ncbi:MAG: M4 family metallopeptidase [Candidatus Latescibacterota bacterium]
MSLAILNSTPSRRKRYLERKNILHRLTAIFILSLLLSSLPPSALAITLHEKPAPPDNRLLAAPTLRTIGATVSRALREARVSAKPAAGDETIPGLSRDERNGAPVFMNREAILHLSRRSGKPATGSVPFETALRFIEANRELFRLAEPASELRALPEERDSGGRTHLRLEQVYHGIPVWGSRLILHFDADGSLYALNGRYAPTPAEIGPAAFTVTGAQAIGQARSDLAGKTVFEEDSLLGTLIPGYTGPTAEKCIFPDGQTGKPLPVWRVETRPNIRERWISLVDAGAGKVIEAWQANPRQDTELSATAKDALGDLRTFRVTLNQGVYSLADPGANIYTYDAKGKVITNSANLALATSQNNIWPDSIAVSAHANVRATYDYYLQKHNRLGVDGKKMRLPVIVHFTEDGKPYYNAFWAGEYMAFGDGLPFAAALDVVAHELTHGVTQFTVGLEYRFQSGALNEAISDIMASFVDPDWLMGEDLPGGAIRDILNPEKFGLPAHMNNYREMSISQDNGGVHINEGIPSRACALLTEAIGREKAANILYHILDARYLAPRAEFTDMRLAAIQSATDLFGAGSAEATAAKNSFDAVGILDTPSPDQPADVPPPRGGEWIAFVQNGRLTLTPPGNQSTANLITPTRTAVSTETASPVSIDREGSLMVFVDTRNNLRILELDTLKERVADNSGEWNSVALSPDGTRLAATSIYSDSTIYILDLENPDRSKAVKLYTPGTELMKSYTAIYADALDWDIKGANIIYDQFNSVPVQGSAPVEFWNINIMDVEHEVIVNVQAASGREFQVGNPSYAHTNDRYIVCDIISDSAQYCAVTVVDLSTMKRVELRKNGYITAFGVRQPNMGVPRYAPNDRTVIFQQLSPLVQGSVLYTIPLGEDRMTPSGSAAFFREGAFPHWFVKGEPTAVHDDAADSPAVFSLEQNYPNPFNPVTVIPFTLHAASRATLEVFDTLGRKVATLIDGNLPAGKHEAAFDASKLASGIYFSRLRAGSAIETRKMTLLK